MISLEEIIAEVLKKEKKNLVTFLTGAGVSAASGIPTYRSSDGIWVKGTKYHKPEEFGTKKYFDSHPEEVWQFSLVRKKMIEEVFPNENHLLLVEIEEKLKTRFNLITQNIDNLHLRAGSKNVYEIHGNYREVKCSKSCKEILPFPSQVKGKNLKEEILEEELHLLKCPSCDNWLRPNVLWFDEYYDDKTNKLNSVLKIAKNTGLLIVLGTSGATNLPIEIGRISLNYGGYIIDVNLEDNHFTNLIEGVKRKMIIRKNSTEVLGEIRDILNKLL